MNTSNLIQELGGKRDAELDRHDGQAALAVLVVGIEAGDLGTSLVIVTQDLGLLPHTSNLPEE